MEHSVEFVIPEDVGGDYAGERVTVEVDSSESLLAAARAAGVWLPADCQQGWCTTCAARLCDGAVDQSDARRYYDVDREADLILTCVAKPRSDVTVETHGQAAMLDVRADHDLPPGRSKR